jgi:undecaprenyl-diphosphatase
MEHINLIWFNHINAGKNISNYQLWLSIFAAKYLVGFIVLWLFSIWLWGCPKHRFILLLAFSSSMLALLINWVISLVWFHPRPFMIGIGNAYLTHAPDSSFPSDHFTALCAICFVYLWYESIKSLISIILILLTCCVAWARIYVGIHYPFDMLGGIIVSLLSTSIIIYFPARVKRHMLPISEHFYRKLLGKMVK